MASGRIKGITVEIDGNTTKLQSALKDVNSSISKTQNALKDVESLLKFNPGNTELLQQKQEYLAKAVEDTTKKLEKEKEALKQLQASSNTADTTEQQKALQREILATESSLKKLTDEQRTFGSVSKQQLLAAKTKMAELGAKTVEVGKQFAKVSAVMAGFGVAAIAAFKEVDAGVDAIVKKTGATGKALKDMEESLKNIASAMATSFEEVGDAIGEVSTRFHLVGEELEKTTQSFIKFSKINGTNVVSAIDTAQNAMAAFGMDVSNAATLLDVMTHVSQNTGASVEKIAAGLVENATALQEMGMNAYQAAYFMGQLETAGADSASVISGLKRALKSATDEGIDFKTALQRMQDGILNSTNSMSGLERAYDLFGKSGAGVFTAVQKGQIDFVHLAETTDILNASMGAVNNTYEATLSFTDRWRIMTNNLKIALGSLGEAIGEVLLPMIDNLIEVIKSITDWFNSLSDSQKNMVVVIGLVVAAIGPLITLLGSLETAIGVLNVEIAATPVGWILAAIAAVVLAIVDVVNIIKWLYNECDNFRNLVDELMWDIDVIMAEVITDIQDQIKKNVEMLSYWATHWEELPGAVNGAVKKVINDLLELNQHILNSLHSIPQQALELWNNYWKEMHENANDWMSEIKSSVKEKFDEMRETQHKAEDKMREQWYNMWEYFYRRYVSRMIDLINAIWDYFNHIVNIVKSILKHFIEVWDDFWEKLKYYKEKAEEWGRDIVENMRTGIKSKFKDLKAILTETAQTIKDYLGFSEPKEGPLSNFHTYMPDMMDLMVKGINDNLPKLEKASDKIAETLVPATNTDLQYDLNATTTASVDNLTNLFEDYLPQLAQAQNVQVVLEGDAKGVFKVVRQENARMIRSTGYHALA